MLFDLKTISLSLLSLSLPLAVSAGGHTRTNRHHGSVAKRAQAHNSTLEKRDFSNARWTFYDVSVGLGACGKQNEPSDFTVALNSAQYGGGFPGPHCFKQITMTYNGKTTQATIMDECPGCPYGGLDLTEGLFKFFASESVGVIYGDWSFSDGSDQPPPPPPPPKPTTSKPTPTSTFVPPPPTTTSKEKPTTTSTKEQPTTTSTSSSFTPTSSSQSSTHSSTSSTLSSSAHSSSAASSSAAPSAIPSVAVNQPSNIGNLNQYLLELVAVISVGASPSSS